MSQIRYANQGATRRLPLGPELTKALAFLPELGVEAEVFSGGQPATGLARVGSRRHDHGNAADVFFYKDGRKLDWSNPQDVPIFQEIVRKGKAAGLTGFGAGPGYMQPGSMHIGFGTPSVWGAGGKGANAPKWLREAYEGGGATAQANNAAAFDPTAFGAIPLDAPQAAAPSPVTAFAPEQPAPAGVQAVNAVMQPQQTDRPIYQVAQASRPTPFDPAQVAEPVTQQPAGGFDPVAAGAIPFDPVAAGAQPVEEQQPEERGFFRRVDDAVRGAADAATFGFSDEIAAGLNTGFGLAGDYDKALEAERQRDAQGGLERVGGQLAGGVAAGVLSTPAKVLSLGGRVKQGIALGAAGGAAYGFGSGEGGVAERGQNALTGAVVGGALGGALPVATAGIRKGYNALMDATVRPAANTARSMVSPQSNALGLVQRSLARDGLTPDDAAQRLAAARAAGDDTTMLMDVAGDNTRRLARFATNIPGEGAEKLKSAVFERQLAQPDRVISAVRKGLRDPEEFYQTLDDLISSREAYAAPMYKKALGKPVVWTNRLQEFLDDPVMRRGLAQGVKIQRLESLAKGEKFNPSDYAIVGFNDAGDPIIGAIPNMRTLNVIKKGLDVELGGMKNPITGKLTEEGRALDMVRRAFLNEIDKTNPAYKEARSVFASHLDAQFAVERGRDLLKADGETARRTFAAMTESEKEFARVGVSKAIVDDISKTRDGLDTVRKIFGSPQKRDVIKAVFPDEESFSTFRAAMEREAQKTRSKTAIQGNSTTAQQMAELAGNQVDIGVAGRFLSGDITGAVMASVQKALSRATVVNEGTAKEIADVLTSSDPGVAAKVIAEMQTMAAKDAKTARNLAKIMDVLRKGAILNASQQTTGAMTPARPMAVAR